MFLTRPSVSQSISSVFLNRRTIIVMYIYNISHDIYAGYIFKLFDIYEYLRFKTMFSKEYKKNPTISFLKRPLYLDKFQYMAKKSIRKFCIANDMEAYRL